jgi:antirestriction protein ArdC
MSPYSSPFWVTYRQAQSIGGHVNAGEKSTPIVFWKFGVAEVQEPDGEVSEKQFAMCRLYHVFNVEQCTLPGLDLGKPELPNKAFNPIPICEQVIAHFANKPAIYHHGDRAFYTPSLDTVTMPPKESFDSPESYYSTVYHELTHSTGHESRLKREGINMPHFFGDAVYSKEELIAECGAAFLSGYCGIVDKTLSNSASYLDNWIRVLKSDSRLIFHAASAAQRATDLILGTTAGEKSPVIPSAEPKAYSISAASLTIAATVKCPIAALRVPGNKPILIKRKVLKIATANMKFTAIGISKDDSGRRFLNVVGTDKKNPKIHRRYAFADQDVRQCRKLIAHWTKAQRTHQQGREVTN